MDQTTPVSAPRAPMQKIDGPGILFSFGWKMFTSHWKTLAPILIIPAVISFVGRLLGLIGGPVGAILAILLGIAGVVFSIAMIPAMIDAVDKVSKGMPAMLKGQYRFGFSMFWSTLLVVIINGLVGFGSFALFVIPGIVMVVYGCLYTFTFVLDGKRGFGALTESYSLVHGRWWPVFGRGLLLVIVLGVCWAIISFIVALIFMHGSVGIMLVPFILQILASIILVPIALGYVYKMYQSLKATRDMSVQTRTFKGWLIAFLVLGILAVIAMITIIPAIMFAALSNARLNDPAFQSQLQTYGNTNTVNPYEKYENTPSAIN